MSLTIEKKTIMAMIGIFCKKNHGSPVLCFDCEDLLQYAFKRIDHCPLGAEKPACNKCTVHCYAGEKRDKIREVMHFSGPRMPVKHPLLTLLHFMK